VSLTLAREYAALVDARDWDGAAALFTEDGVLVTRDGTHTGRAAIRSAFAALASTDATRHDVTGVDEDGHVTCVAHHVVGERCVDWYVHYVDTVVDGRFARRELVLERTETHPAR
jgi:hypothetical protein